MKKAIHQAKKVGFDGVIQSFGSRINVENNSNFNIKRHKRLYDYAHSLGLKIGGYTLAIIKDYPPILGTERATDEGKSFYVSGKSGIVRCMATDWAKEYWTNIFNFMLRQV